MRSYSSHLKSGSSELPRLEILQSPITVLIATSDTQKTALASLGVTTVFDLGANTVFAIASMISNASRNENAINKSGFKSNDWFQTSAPKFDLEQCAEADIVHLRCLTAEQAQLLKQALTVNTVRELALWPQYVLARDLVSEELGAPLFVPPAKSDGADELVPRFGEFPTERVYYDNLVMLQSAAQDIPPEEITKPISVKDALSRAATSGSKPAVGAIITIAQSWCAQGVTLGQMLHSLALAPGESTRIAVADWQRKTRASVTEITSETEALDTASEHSRAMSEVQSGVASEMQSGGATSTVASASESAANQNTSGGVSVDVLGWIMGSGEGSAGVSDSSTATQSAKSTTQGQSTSWSLGTRSTMAQMSQRVNDSTQQHSTSVRNRRASAVREVSQSENESITTRIVANYNHMHALTVQYYEVVQIYRTDTSVSKAERCLFIPFEAMTFDDALIDRFRSSLIRAALGRTAFSLLTDEATAVTLTFSDKSPILPAWMFSRAVARLPIAMVPVAAEAPLAGRLEGAPQVAAQPTVNNATPSVFKVWDQNTIARISQITGRGVFRPDSKHPSLPDDTEWTEVAFSGIAISQLRIQKSDETLTVDVTNGSAALPASFRLIDLVEVSVAKKEKPAASGSMTMTMSYLGRRFPMDIIPVDLPEDATTGIFHSLVRFSNDRENRKRKLIEHLNAHRDHYTRAVLSALDSTSVAAVLSGYTWNNKPLIEVVEPRPYAVAGSYVVFRAPCDEDELSGVKNKDGVELTWEATLLDRNISGQPSDSRLIPIPTSGVFAEAVLGRSNSAEKLDITRFWNWQDSPIPLQAPEIAAIQAGSRGQLDDLKAGQLGQPVLNIVNPTNLPDPAGLGATLSALQNGNMFRDMSGLAQLLEAMKSAQLTTTAAATDAGQIASANMRASMQKQVALAQAAADVVKTIATKGVASGGGGSQGISAEGAKINHGKDMDSRGVSSNGRTASSTGGYDAREPRTGGNPSGTQVRQTANTNAGGGGEAARSSRELDAFNSAVHGSLGASGEQIAKSLNDSSVQVIQEFDLRQDNGEERRAFGDIEDTSNSTRLFSFSREDEAKFFRLWTPVPEGGLVAFANPKEDPVNGVVAEGRLPGRTKVILSLYSKESGTSVRQLAVSLSVPQFFLFSVDMSMLENILGLIHLRTYGSDIIASISKQIMNFFRNRANIRLIWARDQIPAIYKLAGGKDVNITHIMIEDNARVKDLFGQYTPGSNLGSGIQGKSIKLWPANFFDTNHGLNTAKFAVAQISALAGAKRSDAIDNWKMIFSRLMAENIAHEMIHSMLAPLGIPFSSHPQNPLPNDILADGPARSFEQRAGIEVIRPDFPQTGSFSDNGRTFSTTTNYTQSKLDDLFPVARALD